MDTPPPFPKLHCRRGCANYDLSNTTPFHLIKSQTSIHTSKYSSAVNKETTAIIWQAKHPYIGAQPAQASRLRLLKGELRLIQQ